MVTIVISCNRSKIAEEQTPSFPSPHSHEKSLLIGSLKDDYKVLCPVRCWMISAACPLANTQDVVFGAVGVKLSLLCGLFKPGGCTSLGTEGRPREETSKRCCTLGRARAPGAIGPEPHVPVRSSSPGPGRLQFLWRQALFGLPAAPRLSQVRLKHLCMEFSANLPATLQSTLRKLKPYRQQLQVGLHCMQRLCFCGVRALPRQHEHTFLPNMVR